MELPIINNKMTRLFSSYRAEYPSAVAIINGSESTSTIRGEVLFYQLNDGVYIKAYITGIPDTNSKENLQDFMVSIYMKMETAHRIIQMKVSLILVITLILLMLTILFMLETYLLSYQQMASEFCQFLQMPLE